MPKLPPTTSNRIAPLTRSPGSITAPHLKLLVLFRKPNFFMRILPPFHFVCPLFHFRMSQNIVLFLKIKVINLLMFLLYPY